MKVRIQVVIEAENGAPEKVQEIARLERGALRAEELGLTLAEAKALLHGMQQAVVIEQIEEYLEKFKTCPRLRRAPDPERATSSRLSDAVWESQSGQPPSLRLPLPAPRPP
jgi:hypothetical protein